MPHSKNLVRDIYCHIAFGDSQFMYVNGRRSSRDYTPNQKKKIRCVALNNLINDNANFASNGKGLLPARSSKYSLPCVFLNAEAVTSSVSIGKPSKGWDVICRYRRWVGMRNDRRNLAFILKE